MFHPWGDPLVPLGQRQALSGIDSGASNEARGSTRPSGFGSHQFHLPISSIVAGTRIRRTTVASSAIATARPRPISFTDGTPVPANTAKTATMISAALEIVFADAASPCATDVRESPVAS